ncbi:MAG: ComEC/Rec2 family competence protein [Candidatus Kapaibacteriota bacterium]
MFNKLQNLLSVKLLLFTILGFIFQKFFHLSFLSLNYYLFALAIIILFSFLLKKYFLFVFIVFFYFGIFASYRTNDLDYEYKGNFPPELKGLFHGEVTEKLKSKGNTSRFIITGEITTASLYTFTDCKTHFTLINSKKRDLKLKEGDKIFCLLNFRLPNNSTLPNEFNEKNYYRSLGADFTAYTFSQNVSILNKYQEISLKQNLINSISNQIDRLFSNLTSGIVKALLLGDKSNIPLEIKKNFSLSGTAHILAVSGLHVGLIASLLFWLFSFVKYNSVKFTAFVLVLWSYIYLIGFQPSAVRAGIMITLYTLTRFLQRKPEPLNIIALTVLIVLAVTPNSIYSAGFQMSIASITGITLLYKPFFNFLYNTLNLKKIKFLKNFIISSLALTLSASVIVSPIVAYYFGIYSIISPLTNLFVVLLMVYSLILAIPSVILSYLFFPLAQIFANASQLLIELSEIITNFSVKLPGAFLEGQNVFIISLIISFIFLYLLTSKSINQLAFRTIILMFCSISLYFFPSEKKLPFIEYDRPTSKVIEFPYKNIIVILDKKDNNSNRYDYSLLRYLEEKKDSSKIYYDGKTGILLENKMKNLNSFIWVKISDNIKHLIYDEIKKVKS